MKKINVNGDKKEFLESLKGNPVFLLCMRYSYRGIVQAVSDNTVILKDAYIVLSTGNTLGKKAVNEEPLPGLNLITLDSIEGIFPFLPFIFN